MRQPQLSEQIELVEALLDYKKDYAPQAIRKLKKLCLDKALTNQQLKRIACLYLLLQLEHMARDEEVIKRYDEIQKEPWWKLTSYSQQILNQHMNASYWRLGRGSERLNQLKKTEKQQEDYFIRRSHEFQRIQMMQSLKETKPKETLKHLNDWLRKYQITESDQEYQLIQSFKAEVFGAIGLLRERLKTLEALSDSPSNNIASFPELRLSALLIDFNMPKKCNKVLKSGYERLSQTSEHLKQLIYSELKLTAAWCALNDGLYTLTLQLTEELAKSPQRVGMRFRSSSQWDLMVDLTRYVSLRGTAQLNEKCHLSSMKSVWLHKTKAFFLKSRIRKSILSIMKTSTPITSPLELTQIPLSLYPVITELFGHGSELIERYPIHGVEPWMSDFIRSVFDGGQEVKKAPSEILKAVSMTQDLKARCKALALAKSSLSSVYYCEEEITPSPDTLVDKQQNITLNEEGARFSTRSSNLSYVISRLEKEKDIDLKKRACLLQNITSLDQDSLTLILQLLNEPKNDF